MARKKHEESARETTGMMRWLLTYADMLTLLFALFILMYAVSQAERSANLKALESQLFERFQPGIPAGSKMSPTENIRFLSGGAGNPARNNELILLSKNLAEAFKNNELDNVDLRMTDRGLVVSVLTDNFLFDSGSIEIKARNVKVLDLVAKILTIDSLEATLEGHTCDLPLSPESKYRSNLELSALRASSVAQYFIRNGVDPKKLTLAGYGEYHPLVKNDTEENRRKNRRVDIVLKVK